MKKHSLCKLFPEITGDDFKSLVLDIKSNGLRQPIITLDGQILDGGNRYAACIVAGIEPEFKPYLGVDPLAFVISQNMSRRHLTDDQRAAIGAEIARAKHGGDRGGQESESDLSKSDTTIASAAAQMKVSQAKVKKAKAVRKESPAAFKKVKAGKMSLNAAHERKHPRKKKHQSAPPTADIVPPDPEPKLASVPAKTTPKAFADALAWWETHIEAACTSQKERTAYGIHANALASKLLNPVKKDFNAYTSH